MNNLKELNKQINKFINNPSGWDFFMGVRDLVEYIKQDTYCNKQIEVLSDKKNTLLEEEKTLEKKAIQELRETSKRIMGFIKRDNLDKDVLCSLTPSSIEFNNIESCTNKIKYYFLENSKNSTEFVSTKINQLLQDVCISLLKSKNINEKNLTIIKEFEERDILEKIAFGKFIFSDTLKKRERVTSKLEYGKEKNLSDTWEKLILTLHFPDNLFGKLDSINEKGCTLSKALSQYEACDGDETAFISLIPNYKKAIRDIKNYLESGMDKNKKEIKVRNNSKKTTFNNDKILYLNTKDSDKISFAKAPKMSLFLDIILNKIKPIKNDVILFSKIADHKDKDALLSNKYLRNGIDSIDRKIKQETNVKDFFINISTDRCEINSKYL